jgi:hypothetical protein
MFLPGEFPKLLSSPCNFSDGLLSCDRWGLHEWVHMSFEEISMVLE